MKWKTALTAEEAALFAVGFEGYESLEVARNQVDPDPGPDPFLPPYNFSREQWEDGSAEQAINEDQEQRGRLTMAEDIYEALLAEIYLADPYPQYEMDVKSCLVVAHRVQAHETYPEIVCKMSTVTKISLAKWFWQHDHAMAKRFWPSITEELALPPLVETPKPKVNIEPSTKSKNAYLKTIGALSEALIDGLTGKPNTDAEVILASLASKKVEEPVSKKTLAAYLDQYNNL